MKSVTGVWTQGLVLAKQVLHHLNHTCSPMSGFFCSALCLWDGSVSHGDVYHLLCCIAFHVWMYNLFSHSKYICRIFGKFLGLGVWLLTVVLLMF
jgi:hypothetical protein